MSLLPLIITTHVAEMFEMTLDRNVNYMTPFVDLYL